MEKLLLHVCCAPCSTAVIERLKNDFDVVMYFYNPNIYPEEEYNKRLENARIISKEMDVELIEDIYDPEKWKNAVKGLENEKEGGRRCSICFEFRMKKCADYAESHGFKFFTTTLSVSPYKNYAEISRIGNKLKCFLDYDFKKENGYKRSIDLSKQHNLYRQHYCGCRFSIHKNIASPKL